MADLPAKREGSQAVAESRDKDISKGIAHLTVGGLYHSAGTMRTFGQVRTETGPKCADMNETLALLRKDIDASKRGDSDVADRLLISQAFALDTIFNEMMRCAALNAGEYPEAFERYMRLGLKAQGQCRATLESLARIKNPPNVAFVRQANIANGPQQVNNGTKPPHAQTTERPQNEKLEVVDGEWMDAGAQGTAIGGNPAMEAVGAHHGA